MTTSRFIALFFIFQIAIFGVLGGVVYTHKEDLRHWLRTELSLDTERDALTERIDTLERSVTGAIEAANPAVVSVVVTKDVPIFEQYLEEVSPFGFFGGTFQVPRVREKGSELREVGGGSGFIVSSDGLVVTNRHVVDDQDAFYSILTNDGASHEVTVVARDSTLDIAVLQIESDAEFPHLTFADSDKLQLGQTVIAIGNALAEFRNSVSVGVVSGLSRTIICGRRIGNAGTA